MNKLLPILSAAIVAASCGGSGAESTWFDESNGYCPLEQNRRLSYLNLSNGKEVDTELSERELVCTAADIFRDGLAAVSVRNARGNRGVVYLDKNGKIAIGSDLRYAVGTFFSNGLAWVCENPAEAPLKAIDTQGDVAFELPDARTVHPFSERVAVFENAERNTGVVDTKGRVVIEPGKFSIAAPCAIGGLLPVIDARNATYGLIDLEGNIVVECIYRDILWPKQDPFLPQLFPTQIEMAEGIRNGRIIVQGQDGSYGIIDGKGNTVIEPQYVLIQHDGDNYKILKRMDDEWTCGWCDKDGKIIIEPQYASTGSFHDSGFAPVCDQRGGKWYYIDTKGQKAFEGEYFSADDFVNSVAVAEAQDKYSSLNEYSLIDSKGNILTGEKTYSSMQPFTDSKAVLAYSGGYYGLLDGSGKPMTEFCYTVAGESLLSPYPPAGKSFSKIATGYRH